MRYLTGLLVVTVGVAVYRSAPGPIIPYLRRKTKTPEEFASGLKITMAVRRPRGIVGIILAVPILAAFKIFCDHIEPMQPIAEFLS